MSLVDHSLMYLRESLSNYVEEDDLCQQIWSKLEDEDYEAESDFVEKLEEEEIVYLDTLLAKEINYAKNVQDEKRVKELNDVYELLF